MLRTTRHPRLLTSAGLAIATLVVGVTLACRAGAEDKAPAADTPANEAHFTLATNVQPSPLQVGTEGTLRITITPQAPWILKMITPLKVTLAPKGALTLKKTELGKDDVEDPSQGAKTLKTGIAASAAGAHSIDAALSFFLCTDEICQRHETTTTIAAPAK